MIYGVTFCRGKRLHAFLRHARFLGLRFVRRWPKAPPRGILSEYAVSPRLGLRSPASLSAATCTFTQQPFLNHAPTITQPQPRLNHPSCRIQERFRLNHPTSTILQIRQHRATRPWLVHQLPRPPRHFLHHPRREGDREVAGNAAMSAAGGEKRKTLEKWAFRGVCPSSFPPSFPTPSASFVAATECRCANGANAANETTYFDFQIRNVLI